MFFEIFDNICFEATSPDSGKLQYLCSEFPRNTQKTISDIAFQVELSNNIDLDKSNYTLDNGRYHVSNKMVFRCRDSIFLDNRFCFDFNRSTPVLKIPHNIISQRYMLLRLIYPLIRFSLLKKNALLLKASCTSSDGDSTLYAGFSGAGKTMSVLKDLANGSKYVSDTMSVVTADRTVIPLNNCLHVFWRNRKLLQNTPDTLNINRTKVIKSLYLRQILCLLTLKKKALSTIVNIPDNRLERNKTRLSKIVILDDSNSSSQQSYFSSQLVNILYSINHAECLEFNRLLDVFSYIGINDFDNYWPDFRTMLTVLVNNFYMQSDENSNLKSTILPDVFAGIAKPCSN